MNVAGGEWVAAAEADGEVGALYPDRAVGEAAGAARYGLAGRGGRGGVVGRGRDFRGSYVLGPAPD